jgi:DNA-binding protein YbaB
MNNNMNSIAAVNDVQAQFKKMQEEITVSAKSSDEKVEITINGRRQILNLEIKGNLFLMGKETLQKNIIDAINNGNTQLDTKIEIVKQKLLANAMNQMKAA